MVKREGCRLKKKVVIAIIIVVVFVFSGVIVLFGWLVTQPSKWYKIGEAPEGELEDWQKGDVYIGETLGTLFLQIRWKDELPDNMRETRKTENNPNYPVYTVMRSTYILIKVSGYEHEIKIAQGFSGIWVFKSSGVVLIHQVHNETVISIGIWLNPPPSWFSPLSSVQNVIVNNSFGISSDAKADENLGEFPYYPSKEITVDGAINDWVDIENLTLDVFPQQTRDLPGAIVNASAFASDTQLGFLIVLSQNGSTIRMLYPNLDFSAHLYGSVGWYSKGYYYVYSYNFYLDGANRSLIIFVYNLPEGWCGIDEFEVGENQWAFGDIFEFYLTNFQAESFYDLYPAEDYHISVSSDFEWTYTLSPINLNLNSLSGINTLNNIQFHLLI